MSQDKIIATFDRQIMFKGLIPEWTALEGKSCIYHTGFRDTAGGVLQRGWFWGSKNPDVMVQLARQITSAGTIANWKKYRAKMKQFHHKLDQKIHNTSNARILVEGFLCICRRDQGRTTLGGNPGDSLYRFPLELLGTGFSSNGIDTTTHGLANAGIDLPQFTPYDSYDFCSNYKIIKRTSQIVKPGEYACFTYVDNLEHSVRPEDNQVGLTAAEVWNDIDALTNRTAYEHYKGEQFWLFKLSGDTVGEYTATDESVTLPALEFKIETIGIWKAYMMSANNHPSLEHGYATAEGFSNVSGTTDIVNPQTDDFTVVENL